MVEVETVVSEWVETSCLAADVLCGYQSVMKHEFTAIIRMGDKYFIGSCPEVPEANGQGETREECLEDLAAAIELVLEYKRDEALSELPADAERTVVSVG